MQCGNLRLLVDAICLKGSLVMVTHDVYVLIEYPKKGIVQVHYMPSNDFIAKHSKTRVFVRSGVKFHAIATGGGKPALGEIKRLLDNLWDVMIGRGMIRFPVNLPEVEN